MRAVGLHPDVVVFTSREWQTNAVAVRGSGGADASASGVRDADDVGGEAFLIDSPIFPDELEALPAVLEQAGFAVAGLLATHGDWDHLLGRLAFPGAPLGCAETTAARLTGSPGEAARELRAWDEEHYVSRAAPLSLPGAQALPVPGYCGVGGGELELHPAEGHTVDGMVIWIPWASVLVCGDYLSPLEIPTIGEDATAGAYLATLDRLEPLVGRATSVVPGHGAVLDSARAAAILREDVAYLRALADRGAEAPLPLARRTSPQRRAHVENVARVAGGVGGER